MVDEWENQLITLKLTGNLARHYLIRQLFLIVVWLFIISGIYLLLEFQIATTIVNYLQGSARQISALELGQDLHGIYCGDKRQATCQVKLLAPNGQILGQIPTIQSDDVSGGYVKFSILVERFDPPVNIVFSSRPSNRTILFLVSGAVLIGIISFVVLLVFDLKRRELYLKDQLEKMQLRVQADAAIARLGIVAAQVSHDIRSPISAINVVIKSLKDIPSEQRSIIVNASNRINDIANNLLQSVKTSGGVGEDINNTNLASSDNRGGTVEVVSLLDLISEVVLEKSAQYSSRENIKIISEKEMRENIKVRIDKSDLSRIISNLVNNAVEAMPNGGQVAIAIRYSKDTVFLTVSDSGEGIPAHVLERVGQRGFSFGKSGQGQGNGLGLSHAIEVLNRYGGKFDIKSQIGVGTIVTISLPRF